jgi:hypothetical protein
MKYPIPFPATIKCKAANIIPIIINTIPYNTFILCMLAMKVLSLVIYYNGKPHLPKESKEKLCNSSLSVCFQYYIDNNVPVVYNVYVVTSH